MRYMIIVKATSESEVGCMPEESLFAAMADYHEELTKAGVLLAADGLAPSRDGWRVVYDGATPTVVDGPFAETKELIAGFTIISANSREEALAWSRRFPNPAGPGKRTHIEVRRIMELDDFEPTPQLELFRKMEQSAGSK